MTFKKKLLLEYKLVLNLLFSLVSVSLASFLLIQFICDLIYLKCVLLFPSFILNL